MGTRTNCINCGAPLHYTETDYGRTSRCEHCLTEYHIDELGRVKENLVKIKLLGQVVEFYIQSISVMQEADREYFRDENFMLRPSCVVTNCYKNIKIELEGRL